MRTLIRRTSINSSCEHPNDYNEFVDDLCSPAAQVPCLCRTIFSFLPIIPNIRLILRGVKNIWENTQMWYEIMKTTFSFSSWLNTHGYGAQQQISDKWRKLIIFGYYFTLLYTRNRVCTIDVGMPLNTSSWSLIQPYLMLPLWWWPVHRASQHINTSRYDFCCYYFSFFCMFVSSIHNDT